MPSVIARDAVAADHLVYAWPFPIGAEEQQIACGQDEEVVMCPAWLVGDRLGPGRHRWATPQPVHPVSAFFVRTAPVDVPFDLTTSFLIPSTGQLIKLRATGSLQVRCTDPGLLVAQFVGLPFDSLNDGLVRSVSRSVERMLARLLMRRAIVAGTPTAATDPAMLPNIVEELVAYNPAAGAVFGIEHVRMGHVSIFVDDGTHPATRATERSLPRIVVPPGATPVITPRRTTEVPATRRRLTPPLPLRTELTPPPDATPPPNHIMVEPVHASFDDVTQQSASFTNLPTPRPAPMPVSVSAPVPAVVEAEPQGAIIGIGMGHIGATYTPMPAKGSSSASAKKIAPGARVLVPGPHGLMQSATVLQLVQGYYELEVGASGETIWVPANGVVPE